jgi:hypothetical protein
MTKKKLNYSPSHNDTDDYVILMETSGSEKESWYNFIKVQGNEENLQHLCNQLDCVEWYILEHLSVFFMDLEKTVSAQTAKEMTKVSLNEFPHRKFDGTLQKIDLNFSKKDGNDTKICKTFDALAHGKIGDFIDDEDIDEEDLETEDESTENESISDDELQLDIPDEIISDLKKKLKTTT